MRCSYKNDTDSGFYYLNSRYYDPETGRFLNADNVSYLGSNDAIVGYNLFSYCGNNPINNSDSGGNFFFTALGAVAGFVSGAITSMISNSNKESWFENATHSAIGGAIAGAGVDAGLLILGTAGTATPAVVAAVAAAYALGGAGNAYTTYATSSGTATGANLLGSFIIGGTFNTLSFATGLGAISNSIEGLFIRGTADFTENLLVGVGIGISAGIATELGKVRGPNNTPARTNYDLLN